MIRFTVLLGLLLCPANFVPAQDGEPFRPEPGEFPPLEKAKSYRGELVFVDHVNRRGSLRLHVDGHYHEGKLHHFAMLPYGMIHYRGAPAELRDIPLGTIMYGRFFLPPDPGRSAVPNAKGNDVTQPAENYAILLEDGPSLCLREGKAWRLNGVEIANGESGILIATLEREEGGDGLGGEYRVTIDESTQVWRGRELLGVRDLVAEGIWPESGKKGFDGQAIQMSLAWHPRYLYQEFHAADLWLDETAMKVATERQRGRHLRHIRTRWMPARIDAVEHSEFGHATVTATLIGGMDESLYADFKPDVGATMAAAAERPNLSGILLFFYGLSIWTVWYWRGRHLSDDNSEYANLDIELESADFGDFITAGFRAISVDDAGVCSPI